MVRIWSSWLKIQKIRHIVIKSYGEVYLTSLTEGLVTDASIIEMLHAGFVNSQTTEIY